jgi:hypothetical protein
MRQNRVALTLFFKIFAIRLMFLMIKCKVKYHAGSSIRKRTFLKELPEYLKLERSLPLWELVEQAKLHF